MGGRVILLHVKEFDQGEIMPEFAGMPGYVPVPVMMPQTIGNERERLEALKMKLPYAGEMETLVIAGSTVSTILQTSEVRHADLIIMGSHGHGAVYNLLVGSVTEGVLKSAKCPVLIVPSAKK